MSAHKTQPVVFQIYLDIQWNSSGKPSFLFFEQLPWVLSNGTLDMTTAGSKVKLSITLVSTGGETFADPTIGIVPHPTNQDPLCPAANNGGHGVFHKPTLSADARTFSFFDDNGVKERFFYALWFKKPGMKKSFPWDPIIINKDA